MSESLPQPDAPLSLSSFGLPGWSWHVTDAPSGPVDWTWTDGQGTQAGRVAGRPQLRALRSRVIGTALVDPDGCRIGLHDLAPGVHPDLVRQWVADQVVPRLLSHLGRFVVHAGAVLGPGGRALLIVAPSGHGKSTLTGYLDRGGWPLLGDDATLLDPQGPDILARPVYPRLKVLPDTWRHLHPDRAPAPRPAIRKISVDLGSPPQGGPVGAILLLSPPGGPPEPSLRRVRPSETCLDLLRGSFALDPSDRLQAGRRLAQAGAVAAACPGFRLSYPREWGRLPEVRGMIEARMSALDSEGAGA